MLFIFAGSVGVAYAAERVARSTYVLGHHTYREKLEEASRVGRTRKQLEESARRARAAGKTRDAVQLEKAALAAANEYSMASMATAGVSLRAATLRNGLPLIWLWIAGAILPSDTVLTLPVPAIAPLSWLTHRGVEGEDFRQVGLFAVWLICSALATQVLPALISVDSDAAPEVSVWQAFTELFAEQQARAASFTGVSSSSKTN